MEQTPETQIDILEEEPVGNVMGAFGFGLVVGTLMGAATAILLAPQPGREIREQLGDQAKRLHERASGLAHDVRGGLERLGQRMKGEQKPEEREDQLPSDGIRIL